jgi:hypothetical protein
MTPADVAARRLRNQRLIGPPFATPVECVRWFGAMQAQEFPVAKWSIAQRTKGATDKALARAFADGAILRTHVLRPTWHFVLPADIRWMVELTAPRIKTTMLSYDRKLGLTDAVYAKSNGAIRNALAGGLQRTRQELAAALAAAGLAAKGQRLGHLMLRAELDLVVCSGAPRGKQQTYALVDDRVPKSPPRPRDEALAELTLRYFASHGPATLRDYMWWSSLTSAEARRGVEMCAGRLERVAVGRRTYWLVPKGPKPKWSSPAVHLLQAYDEYVVGYTESKDVLNLAGRAGTPARGQVVFLHAVAIDGQVIGHWKRADGDATTIEAQLSRPLRATEERGLSAEIVRYGRFLGVRAALRNVRRARRRSSGSRTAVASRRMRGVAR